MATRRNALGEAIARGAQTIREALERKQEIAIQQEQQAFENQITNEVMDIRRSAEDRAQRQLNFSIGMGILEKLPNGVMPLSAFIPAFEIGGGNGEALLERLEVAGLDISNPDEFMLNPKTYETVMDDQKLRLISPEFNDSEHSRMRWMNLFSGNGFFSEAELEQLSLGQLSEAELRDRRNTFILGLDETAFGEFVGMAPGGEFTNRFGTARTLEGAKFLASLENNYLRYMESSGANRGEIVNEMVGQYIEQIEAANTRNGETEGGVDVLSLRKAVQAGFEGGEENWAYLMREMSNPARSEAYRRYITGMFTGSIAERLPNRFEQNEYVVNLMKEMGIEGDEELYNEIIKNLGSSQPFLGQFEDRSFFGGPDFVTPEPNTAEGIAARWNTPYAGLTPEEQAGRRAAAVTAIETGEMDLPQIASTDSDLVVGLLNSGVDLQAATERGVRAREQAAATEEAEAEIATGEAPTYRAIFRENLVEVPEGNLRNSASSLFLNQVNRIDSRIGPFLQEHFINENGLFEVPSGMRNRRQLRRDFKELIGMNNSAGDRMFQTILDSAEEIADPPRVTGQGARDRYRVRLINRLSASTQRIFDIMAREE